MKRKKIKVLKSKIKDLESLTDKQNSHIRLLDIKLEILIGRENHNSNTIKELLDLIKSIIHLLQSQTTKTDLLSEIKRISKAIKIVTEINSTKAISP